VGKKVHFISVHLVVTFVYLVWRSKKGYLLLTVFILAKITIRIIAGIKVIISALEIITEKPVFKGRKKVIIPIRIRPSVFYLQIHLLFLLHIALSD
jgi:hypothetical protein